MYTAQEPKIFSIGEAAKLLGVSIETLRRWEKLGKIIIARTPGGTRIFTQEDLENLRDTFSGKRVYLRPTLTEEVFQKKNKVFSPITFIAPLIFLLLLVGNIFFFSQTPLPGKAVLGVESFIAPVAQEVSPILAPIGRLFSQVGSFFQTRASLFLIALLDNTPEGVVSSSSFSLSKLEVDNLSLGSTSGTTTINNNLKVVGDTTLGSLYVSGSLDVSYPLLVKDQATFASTLQVSGPVSFESTVNGNIFTNNSLIFSGSSPSISASTANTSLSLNGGTTGTVNIGNSSTGDIHIGGGTQSSGCTITNNNGSLNCSSDITSSGNLRVNGGTLSTTQTTLSIDVADSGSINFRDSSNTLVSITDEGTTGNINVTGIYKIGGTTGKTIATCGSSQYLGGIAITGGIVTTLGNCNDVSSTTGTDLTLSGDLAVNGGDITSTSSTFNLLNQPTTLNIGSTNVTRAVNIGTGTNADTINIGTGTGTADTINIGGISGTTVNITGGTVNITGNIAGTGFLNLAGMAAPAVSSSGQGRIYYDSLSTVNKFMVSQNGSAYQGLNDQPQPNLVLNSDFGRRNKWMTFMPETFTDTSGWTAVTGTLGSAASNILTSGTAANWLARAGLSTWRDGRFSAQFKFVDTPGSFPLYMAGKVVDANNWVMFTWEGSNVTIRKKVAGTMSSVGTVVAVGATQNNWYWLELEAQGTTYIGKLYSSGASAAAKSSATLVATVVATVADAGLAAGYVGLKTDANNTTVAQWGGLSTGDGGVYVEGWGPESTLVSFAGTKGGQAIGFDETADAGPLGKQWAVRTYIPAASRGLDIEWAIGASAMKVTPSTSYVASLYIKTENKGGTGDLINVAMPEYTSAAGFIAGTAADRISDAGETAWTPKTVVRTTDATARYSSYQIGINYNLLTGAAKSATGTAYVMLSQYEQGSVATPWRNAPADDGSIKWRVGVNRDIATTSNSLTNIDERDNAMNVFLPWDGSIDAMYESSTWSDTAGNRYNLGIGIDGTAVGDSSFGQTSTTQQQETAGRANAILIRRVKAYSAGKHRVAAMFGRYDATGSVTMGGNGYRNELTVTATRGKFDLAEEYSVSDQSIEAGDIVRLAPGSGSTTVEKTIGGYSQDILGIISTDPGITLGNYNSSDGSIIDGNYQSRYGQGSTLRPVALQGRVPVKVTSENGPIKRGDILTSSATLPGYAMKAIKAGRSIGVAMEPFGTDVPQDAGSSSLGSSLSPTVDSVTGLPVEEVKVGKVMTFVNLSFYDPQVYITDSGTLSVIKVGSTPVLLSSSSTGGVGGDITIDNSTTETKQSFTYQIQDRVTKEIIERIGAFNNLFVANLKVGSIDVDKIESKEIDQLKLSLTDLLTNQASLSGRIEFLENTASNSSVLGVLGSSTYTEGTPSASFNDLTIFNKLITTNLGVTGTIQSGLLSIEGINSLGNSAINTLNGDLYLQNNLLGGVNILSGKVTIDREGNVRVEKSITIGKLNISKVDSSSSALGKGIIPTGSTSVDIQTTAVSSESAVFVTPTIETGGQSLIVKSKTVDTGFKVLIEKPQAWDVTFDWFIIN